MGIIDFPPESCDLQFDMSKSVARKPVYFEQENAELLRKLDELKGELKQSRPDKNFHRPSCSCFHCYEKYSQVQAPVPLNAFCSESSPNVPNILKLYDHDTQSAFGPRKSKPPPLTSDNLQPYTRRPSDLNSKVGGFDHRPPPRVVQAICAKHCHPIAGGAPFVTCNNCYKLLQLPKKTLLTEKNQKVRCGGCSAVITVVKKKHDVSVLTDVERTPKFVCDSPNVTVIGATTSSRVHANKDTMTLCSDELDTMTVSSYDWDDSGSEFQSMDGEEVSLSKGQGWCSSKSGDVTSVQSTYPYSDSLNVQVEESNSVEPVSESNLPNSLVALNSSLDEICDPGGPHPPNLVATQSLEKLKFLSLCLPNSSASLERLVDTCEPGLDTPNLVASQASEKLELRSICKLPDLLGPETLLFHGLPNLASLRSLSLEGSAHTETERTPKRIDDSPNVTVIGGTSRMTFSSDDYDSSGYDIRWMDIEEVSSSTGQGLCSSESGDVISIQSTCPYASEDKGKPHGLNAQVEESNSFDPVTESKLPYSLVGLDSVDDIYDPGGIHMPNVVPESNLPYSLVGLDSIDDIYDPGGLHTPKVVALQSLEKLNFLPLSKLPNSSASVERSIGTDEPGLHTPNLVASPSLENLNLPSLCKMPDSLVSPETNMFQGLPDLESLRRLTLEGCVQLQNLPYLPGTMQIDAVEDRVTQSPRYLGGLTALFSSSSHSPVGQIVGGQIVQLNSLEESTNNVSHGARADQSCRIVSLSGTKIARKTLKRKCIAMNVISLDDLQPHFAKRCKDAAKSLGVIISLVNRICSQHGIHRWPFRRIIFDKNQ